VKAGFRVAAIGVESGSREVLKKMRKGIRATDTVNAIRALDENGIVVLLSFMIGAPYERFRDMLSTVRLAVKLAGAGADVVQFTIYTPLPGTAIFRQALEDDSIFTFDWDRFDFLTPVMKTLVHPSVIQSIQYLALYSFYLRRYLSTGGGRERLAWPKSALLPTAVKFILSEKRDYIEDAIALPRELLRTASLYSSLSGTRPEERVREEMLMESSVPIYAKQKRVPGYDRGVSSSGPVDTKPVRTV
jgi:anaerobic magnesium-protoporphyrin IX monomethyl ester cyclase